MVLRCFFLKTRAQAGRLAAACSGTLCSTDLLHCCPSRPSASWWRWSSPCAAAGRWVSPGAARCRSPCCPAASGARCDTCIPPPIAVGDESHKEMIKKPAFNFTGLQHCVTFWTYRLHLVQLLLVFNGHVVELLLLLVELQLELAVLLLLLPQVGGAALLLLVELHVLAVHDLCQLVHRLIRWRQQTLQIAACVATFCSQCGFRGSVVTWVFSVRSV